MTCAFQEPGPRELADGDEERRYRAVQAIDPAAPGAVAALLDALADGSWRVRHAAAERLAGSDPGRAVPALIAAVGVDSSPGRRHAAAGALVQLGAPAVAPLVAALRDPAPELRTAVVGILGDIGDRDATSAVAARLQDDDPNTRAAAAEALGKIGGPIAVTELRGALDATSDAALQAGALDALLHLRVAPPAVTLHRLARDPALVRPALRLAGASDDPVTFELLAHGLAGPRGVREAALAGIGQQRFRHRELPPALSAAIQEVAKASRGLVGAAAISVTSGDPAIRAGAITVLQSAGDPSNAPAIAAGGADERVRDVVADALDALGPACASGLLAALPRLSALAGVVALAALARWRDARAYPHLLDVLEGDDDAVRGPAIDALGRLGDLRAVEPLMRLLGDGDRFLSGAAIGALAELATSGSDALARVREACRSHPEPRPVAMYRLLGRIGADGDEDIVRGGLRAPHRGTRVAAAGAIATLARRGQVGPGAISDVLDRLADEDGAVRASAAQALGAVARAEAPVAPARRAEVARALALALRDDDRFVRAAAALALGHCRAVEYTAALSDLASDPAAPAEAVCAAVRAIADMGQADAGVLASAARHPDPEVLKEVVLAAATIPGEATAAMLLSAADHPRWDVRRSAAAALASRGDRALADAVRRLATSEQDPLVREALEGTLRGLEARG